MARRAERLFQIIQILRSARAPVTGNALAEELEVSLRTLYRDMSELTAQRVPVRGEAGTGYVLDAGYDMPPLMLTPDELEAAVLGASWVARRGDPALARGARDLIGKLQQAIPSDLQPVLLDPALRPLSFGAIAEERFDLSQVRGAIRERRKLSIGYRDARGAMTKRVVWPIQISYMEEVRILVAWCQLREGFRHFRTDRLEALETLEQQFPGPISKLRAQWRDGLDKYIQSVGVGS